MFGDPLTGARTVCGWCARVGNNLTFAVSFHLVMDCPVSIATYPSILELPNYWPDLPPQPPTPPANVFHFLGLDGYVALGVVIIITIIATTVAVTGVACLCFRCFPRFGVVMLGHRNITHSLGIKDSKLEQAIQSADIQTLAAMPRHGAYSPLPDRDDVPGTTIQ